MRSTFLFILLIFISGNLLAQNQKEFNTIHDEIRSEVKEKDLNYVLKRIDSLYEISKTVADTTSMFKAIRLKGFAYEQNGDYTSAIHVYKMESKKIMPYSQSYLKDSLSMITFYSIGKLSRDKGDFVEASKYYVKSLELAQKHNDTLYLYGNYNGFSRVFILQKDFKQGKEYLHKALQYTTSDKGKYRVYNNLSNISFYQKEYEEAKEFLIKAQQLLKEDDYPELLNNYNNLSAINHNLGDHQKGLDYIIKSYELAVKTNANAKNLARALLNISTSYTELKDFKKSELYMTKCDSMMKSVQSIDLKREMYKSFRDNYKDIGNYKKALQYSTLFMNYKDSILNEQNLKTIQDLKLKYETDIKDKELINQAKLLSSRKRQSNYLWVGLLSVIILLGISTYLYRQKLKTQKLLLTNKEALNEEQIAKLLEEQKLETIKAQLNGQNKERERISKDLHDSVSGDLAAIKLQLSQVAGQANEIQILANRLDQVYHEVRAISHDLLPKEINVNTFTDLIHQLISFKTTESTKIHTEFFPENNLNTLSERYQVEIYRIFQELLTNINKHANAKEVFINIIHHEEYINIMMEDNGQGYDTTNANNKGIGLRNIKSRLKELHGQLEITSSPGQGTIVNINIPVIT
ncbi:tetratricopeptide repeat-containing sensor histidine kinase [Aquimarina mytili]|uniref:Oxygen sensor histidine kinase NreB n=1 Tax=Aquimarina mytili TaxID=874423 RepID=A0A936ZX55_9FLAO|nr:ATP-binding protein [Aquimarina mytili]MBL0683886.1 sensor histidine kinase [Aquimarina mytili]